MGKPDQNALGGALAAGALSAVCIAFIGGCAYAFLLGLGGRSSAPGSSTIMVVPEIGLLTALVALPVTLVLTLGIALPLFRLWVRRGYTNVALYVGSGFIIALIGASILAAAHFFDDFMVDSNFLFSLVLMGVSGPVAGFVIWHVLRRPSVANRNI